MKCLYCEVLMLIFISNVLNKFTVAQMLQEVDLYKYMYLTQPLSNLFEINDMQTRAVTG